MRFKRILRVRTIVDTLNTYFDLTLDTILEYAKMENIMSKENTKRNREIEELYFKGYTIQDLAEKFNISKQRVDQILQYQRQLKIQFRRLSKKNIKI